MYILQVFYALPSPEGRPIVPRSQSQGSKAYDLRIVACRLSVEQRYRKPKTLRHTPRSHPAARSTVGYDVTGRISVSCMQDKTLFAGGSFEPDGSSERSLPRRTRPEPSRTKNPGQRISKTQSAQPGGKERGEAQQT